MPRYAPRAWPDPGGRAAGPRTAPGRRVSPPSGIEVEMKQGLARRSRSSRSSGSFTGTGNLALVGAPMLGLEWPGQTWSECLYREAIDSEPQKPRRTPRQLADAVQNGRGVGAALRHLDGHGSEPGSVGVAEALARFLVARCDSHHAGWRVVRQVVVDSAADAPWEKCARRAVPLVAADLLNLSGGRGRTPLARAQHVAAQRRAEQIADHVDQRAVLADLGIKRPTVSPERWQSALSGAVRSRSREQVARTVEDALRTSAGQADSTGVDDGLDQ